MFKPKKESSLLQNTYDGVLKYFTGLVDIAQELLNPKLEVIKPVTITRGYTDENGEDHVIHEYTYEEYDALYNCNEQNNCPPKEFEGYDQ